MSLAPGVSLGPYEIIELIGQGGMGEVYRARDPRLRRDVAVKRSTLQFDERFEREARAIAALNHPNICQVYDVGPDYLVMELVDGVTLAERIAQGAIPVDEALRLADQIGEALAAAHEKFITHRDLKPGNIKIDDKGTVKVLDFGLARIGQAESPGIDDGNSPTLSMNATRAGLILGTAAYMSPEQARGKPVDSRSDIWAFGVVLYEMLTAKRLFTGGDLTETLAGIVKDEPDLSVVPSAVRPLVRACLQKDPRRRLQAIGDRHLLLSQPERQSSGWFWPAVTGAAVAGVAVLGVAALSWLYLREAPAAIQNLRYQITPAGDAAFTYSQISPDGRYIAFVGRQAASSRLYVRALDSLQDREVPGTDGTTYPFWCPDSAHIAFFAGGKLKQVGLAGGPATVVADAPDARGGAWGEDGSIIFTPSVTGTLSRVSASGGPVTTLSLTRPNAGPRDSLRYPTFLPGSDHFFYTIESDTVEGEGVYLGSLAGTAPVRILPDLTLTRFVASPGSRTHGYILFRRQSTLMAQPFDSAKAASEGDAFPVAEQLLNSGNTGFGDFSVSSNGTLLYAAGAAATAQSREIVWLDRNGKRGASILKQEGVKDFALSPDGSKLLYSLATQNVSGDLWLRDVARGASQRFTFGPFSAYGAVWSPNGTTAVFTVFPEDRLYTEAIAAAKPEASAVIGTNTYASSWSADGRLLAYSQTGASSKDDVWLLPLDGERKPRPLKQTPFSESDAQISPDGRWIAYDSDASGTFDVYVESIDAPGVQRQVSVSGGLAPMWRRDGRELFFLANDKTMMSVDVRPGEALTFGAPQALFREKSVVFVQRTTAFQPSPDGRQFLMLLGAGETSNRPLTVVTNWQHGLGKSP